MGCHRTPEGDERRAGEVDVMSFSRTVSFYLDQFMTGCLECPAAEVFDKFYGVRNNIFI